MINQSIFIIKKSSNFFEERAPYKTALVELEGRAENNVLLNIYSMLRAL